MICHYGICHTANKLPVLANFSIGDFYFSQESSISMLVSDVSEPCVIKNKSLWLASGPSIVDMRSIRDGSYSA